jgi:phosphate transport system substrate-binding protein
VYQLVEAAKGPFEAKHPGVSIQLVAGGSRKGLADVTSGAALVGDTDLFAPDDVKGKLVDHKIAVVGFAAVANKGRYNERITALTMQDLAKVFSGQVTDWKALGGTPQKIVVINRDPGSGARTVFGDIVLGGDKFVDTDFESDPAKLADRLKNTPGAISYMALSVEGKDVFALGLKTSSGVVSPTTANIVTGAYPIWSYEHMYTNGQAGETVTALVDYMASDEFQLGVLPKLGGFIPISQMRVSRETDTKPAQ